MSISDDEKAEIHYLLDYLLMTRSNLEKVNPSELSPGMQYAFAWSRPRSEFIVAASKFLRRVIGEKLHKAELPDPFVRELSENTSGGENLAFVANALRSFMPLFVPLSEGKEASNFMDQLANDFIGIYWGDDPRFFSILPKSQGMHKRPFRLAYMRLGALDWEKYLAAAGLSAFERQDVVSSAYRTRWDTIRKWKDSILEQFDLVSHPPERPDWVRDEYSQDSDLILQKIAADGEAYWAEKNTARKVE